MANRTYQVSLNANVAGQFASCIFHWNFNDAGFSTTAAAAVALCDAWLTRDKTHFRQLLPASVTLLSMKARLVGATGGFEGVALIPAPNTGTRSGDLQAAGITPVWIHYPISNGKIRGRTFWFGVSNDDCNDGQFTGAYKTDTATQLGQIFDDLTLVGGGAPVAVFGLYNRTTHAFTDTIGARLSDMVGQQRRRQLPV